MFVSDSNVGIYLLIAMTAMAISMAVIPLMMRIAPVIGMIDLPDARKVHSIPIPRVGGLGIVIGAIVPMLVWLPFSDLTLSIFIGASILLVFGTWDDIAELGHYVKFVGQIAAAGVVVYYGDLYVIHFPLHEYELIPESIGKPFTVVAIVGMINAINHSDGLDGLAGGETLISLSVITYLAFLFNSELILICATATIGGIFGFLRFNSHPARVFMGDGGSQFLGFMLAVLVIILTQQVNTVLSPAIAVLLLGLPIIDILAVFFLRAKQKLNLFKATRNHIHHRLLDISFMHYESVVFIYTVQFILVVSAIPLMYEQDVLLIFIYLLVCTSVFVFLTVSERCGFKVHLEKASSEKFMNKLLHKYPQINEVPISLIETGLSLFIIASALVVNSVPTDFSASALILLLLLSVVLLTNFMGYHLYRLVLFVVIAFSVYLLTTYPAEWLLNKVDLVVIYYVVMSLLAFVAIKVIPNEEFKITTLDYLVIAMALLIEFLPGKDVFRENLIWMIVQIIILFYICELVLQRMTNMWNRLSGSVILALALIAYRGFS